MDKEGFLLVLIMVWLYFLRDKQSQNNFIKQMWRACVYIYPWRNSWGDHCEIRLPGLKSWFATSELCDAGQSVLQAPAFSCVKGELGLVIGCLQGLKFIHVKFLAPFLSFNNVRDFNFLYLGGTKTYMLKPLKKIDKHATHPGLWFIKHMLEIAERRNKPWFCNRKTWTWIFPCMT